MTQEVLKNMDTITPEIRKQVKDGITKYWEDKVALCWYDSDIIGQAERDNVSLSKEEAKGVMSDMLHNHDPDIGMSWGVISELIGWHV
jgi:hypothetical protein